MNHLIQWQISYELKVKHMYLVPINGVEVKCETVEEVAALLAHLPQVVFKPRPIASAAPFQNVENTVYLSRQEALLPLAPPKRELVRRGIPKFFSALETIAGRDLSADEFCEAIGVESGRGLGPRITGLSRFLSGFGVSLDDLISNEMRSTQEKMIWMIAPLEKIRGAMATLGLLDPVGA